MTTSNSKETLAPGLLTAWMRSLSNLPNFIRLGNTESKWPTIAGEVVRVPKARWWNPFERQVWKWWIGGSVWKCAGKSGTASSKEAAQEAADEALLLAGFELPGLDDLK